MRRNIRAKPTAAIYLSCLALLIGNQFRASFAQALQPAPAKAELPGPRPDGSVLLPNRWSLRPAGRQVDLGDFPVDIAMHPSGRYAAVLHCGHGPHQIVVVEIESGNVVSKTPVVEAFYGLVFSHDGKMIFASGAGEEVVHAFDFNEGKIKARTDIKLRNASQRGVPCGLAVSRDGRTLYAANVWGQCLSIADIAGATNQADIFLAEGYANELVKSGTYSRQQTVDPDLAAVTKRAKAAMDATAPDAPFPYACLLDEKRHRLYVSLWAKSSVAVIDLRTRQVAQRWATGQHPTEMVLAHSGKLLYVANANHNTVTVLDTSTGKALETLDASLYPGDLPGATPNSLALSPDEKTLYVANACNNNVAVFDVSTPGKGRSLGFIPVGWYPTSIRVTPDGRHLLVANGKGLTSRPDPHGPQPGKKGYKTVPTQTIKQLFPGTLGIINLPGEKDLPPLLAAWTAQSYQCSPQQTPTGTLETAALSPSAIQSPVPAQIGQPSPIKYCIYIIKENRTYDQLLGDMKEGNGDPELCLFPEKVTPNHHKLAREFVLLDNFYVDAEVSADGHEWSMGAYASDFVEKSWPMNYGHNHSEKFPYPSEGQFPIATPANGYLWDRARQAGVSYRSYGEFVNTPKINLDSKPSSGKTVDMPNVSGVFSLQGHFDPWYHGFDTDFPDVKRAERFISEFKRLEAENNMPRLQTVRLPGDHTSGTRVGKVTPTASVADNDRALGMIVEAISQSKLWPQTAIFVLEDDAQDGPDHVDAHRSPAFIISPYTRRAAVDSTMYSTSGLLRTIELILGLQPMSQFDAAAVPMRNAFQATPDLRPYTALPSNVDLEEKNTRLAWGSDASRKMDFSKEDLADDALLNEVIWRSVRGANSPMPAPIHAAFVFTHASKDDDD